MNTYTEILSGIKSGEVVPYLGPGVLKDVKSKLDGSAIPADSESLILAMTDGKPMSPRLMYEFPRAAMHLENKKGRKFIERFLTKVYLETQWTESDFHKQLFAMQPNYIVDCNRDTQLQNLMSATPHTLVVGAARIAASPYRFDIYEFQDGNYKKVEMVDVNPELPVLFKPLGTPLPEPSYVASDADFVDYITELMGGFAIPSWMKLYRRNKKYVFLGMRFNRDTERMVMSDIIYSAAEPAGWAFIPNANDKEKRYCAKKNIEIIDADWQSLLAEAEQQEAVA